MVVSEVSLGICVLDGHPRAPREGVLSRVFRPFGINSTF